LIPPTIDDDRRAGIRASTPLPNRNQADNARGGSRPSRREKGFEPSTSTLARLGGVSAGNSYGKVTLTICVVTWQVPFGTTTWVADAVRLPLETARS